MANIFAQYAQPVRSVMDYQGDFDALDMRREQLGAAKRTNALADLTAQQQRQTMADQQRSNALIKAAYGGGADGVVERLRATGDRAAIELADKQETQALGRGKTTADTAKTTAETEALKAKARYEAADRLAQKIGMVQTPEDLMEYEAEGIDLGIFPKEKRGASLQKAQQLGGIEQWRAESARAAVPVLEKFKADADMARAKLQSDTSIKTTGMTNETSRATNAATVGATLAGQRSVAETARLGRVQSDQHFNVRQGETAGEDPSQVALNKKFGKPEAGRRWKPDGSLEAIPGGSADAKATASDMGKGSVNDVVSSLRDMYDQLDEAGAITNPAKGSVGNLAAGIASSGVGQATGRMFGTQSQSLRNTVAQQRPLLLQAIMKATGMSAKQMDSNAELKLYLATATDPTLDVAANRRALDMIEHLYAKPGGAPAGQPTPGGAPSPKPTKSPAKISDDAGYNALPSGATFIGPDGKTRRKP